VEVIGKLPKALVSNQKIGEREMMEVYHDGVPNIGPADIAVDGPALPGANQL
jgi:hypothetical protein